MGSISLAVAPRSIRIGKLFVFSRVDIGALKNDVFSQFSPHFFGKDKSIAANKTL